MDADGAVPGRPSKKPPDTLRGQGIFIGTEKIPAVGGRLDLIASFFQLIDRFPHRIAGNPQLSGKFFPRNGDFSCFQHF